MHMPMEISEVDQAIISALTDDEIILVVRRVLMHCQVYPGIHRILPDKMKAVEQEYWNRGLSIGQTLDHDDENPILMWMHSR